MDSFNHRVLVYDSVPSATGLHAASLVLGQTDLDTKAIAPVSAASMNQPYGAFYDEHQDRLYVADMLNHRVLVWNGMPAESGAPADLILGQDHPAAREPNRHGARGPLTLHTPRDVLVARGSLFVSDGNNRRVLVWSPPPMSPDEAPRWVLGQPNFSALEPLAPSPQHMNPWGMCALGDYLFVADVAQHRVLRFALSP